MTIKWPVFFSIVLACTLGAWYFFLDDDRTAPQPTSELQDLTGGDPVEESKNHIEDVSALDQPIENNSIEAKKAKAQENALRNLGITEEQLNKIRKKTFDAFYNPETVEQFQAELHSALAEQYGIDEADFLVSVLNISNWNEAKDAITSQQEVTGQNYDDLFLRIGLARGGISADEIVSLTQNGLVLPPDTVHQLVATGSVDTLADLVNDGVIADVNYQDPFTGVNALGVLINNIGYSSNKYDAEEAATAVRELISLGVEAMPQDGSFNPLDYALKANKFDAEVKLSMAKVLLDAGVPFQKSHRQLLERMPDGEVKNTFMDALANYL